MAVYSIWESRFAPENAEQGREVTEAIWADMPSYLGYLSHELLTDLDDPGHLLVVSLWSSRKHADDVLAAYADHPHAREANRLAVGRRTRFVAHAPART